MKAAARLAYGDPTVEDALPRCPACVGNSEYRRASGCDEPARGVVFAMTCPKCSGYDEHCACRETGGMVLMHRCPASMVTADVAELAGAASLVEAGILPGPGSLRDQAATFVDAFRLYTSERSRIHDEERALRKQREKHPSRRNR